MSNNSQGFCSVPLSHERQGLLVFFWNHSDTPEFILPGFGNNKYSVVDFLSIFKITSVDLTTFEFIDFTMLAKGSDLDEWYFQDIPRQEKNT